MYIDTVRSTYTLIKNNSESINESKSQKRGVEIKKTFDGDCLYPVKFCVLSCERDWTSPDLSSLTYRRQQERRSSLVSGWRILGAFWLQPQYMLNQGWWPKRRDLTDQKYRCTLHPTLMLHPVWMGKWWYRRAGFHRHGTGVDQWFPRLQGTPLPVGQEKILWGLEIF